MSATGEHQSLDRVLVADGDTSRTAVSLLEITTLPRPYGPEWGPYGSDRVPGWLTARTLWQMDTLGVREAHIAVLAQGIEPREYHLTWDKAHAEDLRGKARIRGRRTYRLAPD